MRSLTYIQSLSKAVASVLASMAFLAIAFVLLFLYVHFHGQPGLIVLWLCIGVFLGMLTFLNIFRFNILDLPKKLNNAIDMIGYLLKENEQLKHQLEQSNSQTYVVPKDVALTLFRQPFPSGEYIVRCKDGRYLKNFTNKQCSFTGNKDEAKIYSILEASFVALTVYAMEKCELPFDVIALQKTKVVS